MRMPRLSEAMTQLSQFMKSSPLFSPTGLQRLWGILCACLATALLAGPLPAHEAVPASAQQGMFAEIAEYARLANAAYEGKAQIIKALQADGYSLVLEDTIPNLEVKYFLATQAQTGAQVVVVRGTNNAENALVDVVLQLTEDKQTGIRLHRGFADAAKGIYQRLQGKLNKHKPVITTGHSLGGAVALILAMYLDVDHYPVQKVITFGQPKVTNISGAQKFSHLNLVRVVTARDLVPLVPPLDPMDLKNVDIFWHLGQEIILLPGNEYAVLTGLDSMLRASGIMGEQLSQENLKWHRMAAYLKNIKAKQTQAIQVPYKTEFDFFGLFGK